MRPIRILLVDDHTLFAKSLTVALEEYREIETFQATQNIPDLPKLVRDGAFSIVLMDINLGGLSASSGLELASDLLRAQPEVKVLILTGYDLPVCRHEARKRGFHGFLNKNISPDELVTALLRLHRGGTCFPQEGPFLEELTSVEKTILRRISTGEKRKEVAQALFISERTLSNHLQHIFEKLGVSSTVEAVTKAIQLGHIPPLC